MDKQKKLILLLPVLLAIMAIVWGPVIMGGGSKKKDQQSGRARSGAVSSGSAADLLTMARSAERKKAKTKFEQWGRNPFTVAESPKAAMLEGIMWDARNPKAIINGQVLGVGDRVGSGEIVDIQPNSVTIQTGTTKKVYKFGLEQF